MSFFRLAARSLSRSTFAAPRLPLRYVPQARYSAAPGLQAHEIQARVLEVLKNFEKVDKSKVCHVLCSRVSSFWLLQLDVSASFANDLGLDSLDSVEVVMAIEEVCIQPNYRTHN